MPDSPMVRTVEGFLVNSMYSMDDRALTIGPDNVIALRPDNVFTLRPDNVIALRPDKKTPEQPAKIRDPIHEPIFWRDYTSEEEVASPIDVDNTSFYSTSNDSIGSVSMNSFPEQLMQSCYRIEQQCSRAQAVTIVPAGKAKVVSMPKVVHVSAAHRVKQTASSPPIHAPVSRLNKYRSVSPASSQKRYSDSTRSSSDRSPVSTAPSSPPQPVYPTKSARREPNVPLLESAYAPITPFPIQSAHCPQSTGYSKQDPFPSSNPRAVPTTSVAPPRFKHKFSSTFNLSRFGKGLMRKDSSDNNEVDLETIKEPEPVPYSKATPAIQTATRSSSVRPKLVPRGASEREPLFTLPPCPENYKSDHDYSLASHWPLRNDPAALPRVMMDPAPRMPELPRRQRSMSVVLVSAQA